MKLTEIGVSEELNNIIVDKGCKVVRIDTIVSKGECYLKQDVRGRYEIYKAASDFSYSELLIIVTPTPPEEITFIYDRFGWVQEGEYFLDTNYELLKWVGPPSKKQFDIYKIVPRVALNEEIKVLL